MKYDVVSQSLEEFVKNSWTYTEIQYPNTGFDSTNLSEFMRLSVIFGETGPIAVSKGCYRVTGLLDLSIYTRPGQGTSRLYELATIAGNLINDVDISATLPLVAPIVKVRSPSMNPDLNEKSGWIRASVSCPFYYDLRT